MSFDRKGLLRRVDVLGRVVIPKEVRKALRIDFGDVMEFFITKSNQVVMQKYELIDDVVELVKPVIEAVKINNEVEVIITDTEKVALFNQEVSGERVSIEIREMLKARNEHRLEMMELFNGKILRGRIVFSPIVANGDLYGAVIIVSREENEKLEKIAKTLNDFFVTYFS